MKKAYNRIEMSGKTYNSWKIIRPLRTVGKIVFYLAECLQCNREYDVDGRNVRLNLSKRCTDCGRKASAAARTGKMRKGIDPQIIALKRILKSYRAGAANRNLSFNITEESFYKLIKEECGYCGNLPDTRVNPLKGTGYSKEKESLGWIVYNGLDRIDSKIGYESYNVITCCSECNYAKGARTAQQFIEWVTRIHANFTKIKKAYKSEQSV